MESRENNVYKNLPPILKGEEISEYTHNSKMIKSSDEK